jgi:diamine N-acetyltransferase
MNLTFRPADKDNFRVLSRLMRTLTPQQQTFVAHNAYSMLEALYEPDNLFAYGIYDDDVPVGFFLYGYDPDDNTWGIVRFMIGGTHQGKGYGRAAITMLLDHMQRTHGCTFIYISFVPENVIAEKLYASVGFVDTGEMDDGEVVYVFRRPSEDPAS